MIPAQASIKSFVTWTSVKPVSEDRALPRSSAGFSQMSKYGSGDKMGYKGKQSTWEVEGLI